MANKLLENLAEYLENENFGTRGSDIFIGYAVDDVDDVNDNIIMLDQTGGAEPDKYLPIAKPTIDVTVRNTSHDNGMEKLRQIFQFLHERYDYQDLVIDGVDVMNSFALNEPQHLARDRKERDIFKCTFVFRLRRGVEATPVVPVFDILLMDSGDALLLDSGDYLLV